MMASLFRRAGQVITVGLVTLAVGGCTADAQTALSGAQAWRTDTTISVPGGVLVLNDVVAAGPRDAWAGGLGFLPGGKKVTLIERWTGQAWRRFTLPAAVARTWTADGIDAGLMAASTRGPDLWAFGSAPGHPGQAIHFARLSAGTWTFGTLPGTTRTARDDVLLAAADEVSPSNVWVFGGALQFSSSLGTVPYAAHFNGRVWHQVPVPGNGIIVGVSALSASSGWALIGADPVLGLPARTPTVVRWNGATWQPISAQPGRKLPAGAIVTTIAAASGGLAVAGNYPAGISNNLPKTGFFAAMLTGSTWRVTRLKGSSTTAGVAVTSLVPDGRAGLWALAISPVTFENNRLWHFDGSAWSTPVSPTFGGSMATLIRLAAVPGRASIWGVGLVERRTARDGLIALAGPVPH